ncbi:MAG: hypothetical protein QE263_05675 [Vampirovibrionales bacterium]|nr:hypothetical protein [Vampirovibrionales bacterium]
MNPDTSRFRDKGYRTTGAGRDRQLSGRGSANGQFEDFTEEELKLLGIQPKNLDDHGPQFSGLNRLA